MLRLLNVGSMCCDTDRSCITCVSPLKEIRYRVVQVAVYDHRPFQHNESSATVVCSSVQRKVSWMTTCLILHSFRHVEMEWYGNDGTEAGVDARRKK